MIKGSHATEETKIKLRLAWEKRTPIKDSTREKLSKSGKLRYSSPQIKEAFKRRLNDPITKQRMSESAKKRCTPEWRKRRSELSKQQMNNPKLKERLANLAKERYLNPEWNFYRRQRYDDPVYRKKMSDARHRIKEQFIESLYGGFWYGNVRHYDTPQYCEKFNKEFKERVRAFWNYQCFECGDPQNGKTLHIHHVHYDKKMCCNGSPQDVVPLCQACHNKTLSDRDYWEDHFVELLYAWNPEGKCFFTKEEMIAFKNANRSG